MNSCFRFKSAPAAFLLFATLSVPGPALGADDSEFAELKRAIQALQNENRKLSERLNSLESGKSPPGPAAQPKPVPGSEKIEQSVESAESKEGLSQRVKELEITKAAQEQATRAIIQDSLSKLGSKINETVTLGGALEVSAGRGSDYAAPAAKVLKFNTAELDFEIQMNPWTLGTFVINYDNGTSPLFSTTTGFQSGVDRINVDRAFVTIGDTQRFPLFFRVGRVSLPFGTSTGVSRVDHLSIDTPLTIEAFEIKKTGVGVGFGYPTPKLTQAPRLVVVPVVKPLLVNPWVSTFASEVGYSPIPTKPKRQLPTALTPDIPPFYGNFYLYDSSDTGARPRSFTNNFVGRLGYRANGHCGVPYEQLSKTGVCPWSLDFNFDYNSSIFDSKFLEVEFRPFVSRFAPVRGLATNTKLTLGALSLVGEWNWASRRVTFVDDRSRTISIRPSAFQLALGYQLNWNPWVESIGTQGTFLALGFSESKDLTGARQVVGTAASRVGFLPKRRMSATVGEWVLDGVKLVFEYSHFRDYSVAEGGTGAVGRGFFTTLTYTW